jgi:cyclase
VLTKRIIACLDVRDGRVVKGIQFLDIVDAGASPRCRWC